MFKLSTAGYLCYSNSCRKLFLAKQKKKNLRVLILLLPGSVRDNNTHSPSHSLEKFIKNFTLVFISPHSFLLWEHQTCHQKPFRLNACLTRESSMNICLPQETTYWRNDVNRAPVLSMFFPVLTFLNHPHTLDSSCSFVINT